MIRVLQVYDSIAISSGISNVIMSWAKTIDKSQVTIDVLACWKKEPDYSSELEKLGHKVYFIEDNDHLSNYLQFVKKVYTFFSQMAKDYDIVHLHSSIFSFPILSAAKKFGIKKRIVHVHSSVLGNTKFSACRNMITLLPMKWFGSSFWACSEEAAQAWYERVGIRQYFIVNNGIKSSDFVKNIKYRNLYRSKWGILDNEILIGHISNMNPVKNVPFVLETAHALMGKGHSVKVVLIGKDCLPAKVIECIRLNNLEDVTINAGVHCDVNKCIQAFDLCLMPSFSEGYGLVPIEVGTSNIPVVISYGFPKVISDLPLSYPAKLNINEWCSICEKIIREKNGNIENEGFLDEYKAFDIQRIAAGIVEKYTKM